jgi:hypothetical protein
LSWAATASYVKSQLQHQPRESTEYGEEQRARTPIFFIPCNTEQIITKWHEKSDWNANGNVAFFCDYFHAAKRNSQ